MRLTRSENMRRIHRVDTRPETLVRRAVWAAGFRYRVDGVTPEGRADLAFGGRRIAVFVDGCFWHGCPHHYVRPRSREAFWAGKLLQNFLRDRRQTLGLEARGWSVFRVWEHDVPDGLELLIRELRAAFAGLTKPPGVEWRVWAVEPIGGTAGLERRYLEDLREGQRRCVLEIARQTRKRGGTVSLRQS